MRPLRVCQLLTELGPAGAERCVYELSRRLDRGRFDTHVVALRGGAVEQWLLRAGVGVTVLGVRGKCDVGKLARLVELLRWRQFDILHTHLFHADLAGRAAAWLAAVPHLVHTVHTAEARFRPWQFAAARLLADRCDRVVAVSASTRDFHARRSGLPISRYTVIPNGVDAAAFARSDDDRRLLRGRWGLAEGQVLCAYVGRLDFEKGVDVLLSAASHLASRGQPIELVVAGDGRRRGLVENFMEHGEGGRRCRYLGFVQDIRGVLSAADLLVMPSRWEGFGLAAAEAMACSLPVVASDVPGLRDVVVHGETGLLVAPADAIALADAIERLSGDAKMRSGMGRAGRKRVVKHYPIQAVIEAHQELYLSLAADRLGE